MRKRSRVVALLVLPVALFIWCIGWILYSTSHTKTTEVQSRNMKKPNSLTVGVLIQEKHIEA